MSGVNGSGAAPGTQGMTANSIACLPRRSLADDSADGAGDGLRLTAGSGTLGLLGVLGARRPAVSRGGMASRADTLGPSCGLRVIFAVHTNPRAPVAQPDRAAAF